MRRYNYLGLIILYPVTYEYALSSSNASFEEKSPDAINSQPSVSCAYFSNMSIVDFACILYALFQALVDHGVPKVKFIYIISIKAWKSLYCYKTTVR